MASPVDRALQWATSRRYERQVPCVCGGRLVYQSTGGARVCLECGAKTTDEEAEPQPAECCENAYYPDLCGQLIDLSI